MPEEQNDQTPAIPDDFAAYEAYRLAELTGETPTSEAPSEDEGEAGTAADSETAEEAEQGEEEEEAEEEADADKPPKKKGGYQRKIDRLTQEKAELEARLEQALAERTAEKPAETAKPPAAEETAKPESKDFKTWDEYEEALIEWRLEQRDKARQAKEEADRQAEVRKAVQDNWNAKVEAGRKAYKDFDTVVVQSKRPVSPTVQHVILDSEKGGDLAYWLGTHPQDLDRINKLPPVAATRELLKVEQQLSKPAPEPKPKVSKAPPPVKAGTAGAPKTEPRITDENISFADYERLRKKQLARR